MGSEDTQSSPPPVDSRIEDLVFEAICARARRGFEPLPLPTLRGLLGRCGLRARDLAQLGDHPGELLRGTQVDPERATLVGTWFGSAAARRAQRLPPAGRRAFVDRLDVLVRGMEAHTEFRFPGSLKTLLVGRDEVIHALSDQLPSFDISPTASPDPELSWEPAPMPSTSRTYTRTGRTASDILVGAGLSADGRKADGWVRPTAITIGIVSCCVGVPLAFEGVLSQQAALVGLGTTLVIVGLGLDAALTWFGARIFGSRQIL